jgi:hypothetical protein
MVEPKFHKRHSSKVGFLAHVALCSKPDVAFNSVKAARRLTDAVPECEKYVDEAFHFLFPTMETSSLTGAILSRCKIRCWILQMQI